MLNLNLLHNESIILQSDNARYGDTKAPYSDELYLTNLNILYVSKGKFGKVKGIEKYPLNQIKIVNGQAQAIYGKSSRTDNLQLQLYFVSGQACFEFQSNSKREISKWVNQISQILTGAPSPIEAPKNGIGERIAYTARDTIGVFKNAFGIKSNQSAENITSKCIGCMAPISGEKGQTVRCKYCDIDNTL